MYENLKFSMDLYNVKYVVVVSNMYYLYWMKIIVKCLGMKMEVLVVEILICFKRKMYVCEYVVIMKIILFDC